MLNIIYKNYDRLKPKQKKTERTFSYTEQMLTQLSQIVRIDDFRDKLDLDLDIAINVKLTEGMVGFTKVGDKFYTVYALQPAGLPRKDGRPYKVTGTYLDDNQQVQTKEFTNDEDIVLWYNNAQATPESTVEFFSYMFTETDTSMEYNIQRSRYNPFIRVKNQKQKTMYEEAMKATHNGEPVVIVDAEDTAFSDNETPVIDVNDVKNIDKIQYLSHFHDDLLKRFSNLYGVSMNMSSKQAQQTEKEISGMDAFSWLLPIDMLNQAKEFSDRFNTLYGIELVAHFGVVHELNFNQFTGDCTSNDESMNDDLEDLQDELQQEQETGEEPEKDSEDEKEGDETQPDKEDLTEDQEDKEEDKEDGNN